MRDAEIPDLHIHLLGHQEIGRLDVAMDDPLLVGIIERFSTLKSDFHDFVDGEQVIGTTERLERLSALDVFHHDVTDFAVYPGIKDADDVRMGQAPRSMRFVEEHFAIALSGFFIAELFGMRHLDRDWAVKIWVVAQVNDAHAAAVDLADDSVLA